MWEMTAVSAVTLVAAALAWGRLGDHGPRGPPPVRLRLAAAGGCVLVCGLMVPGLAAVSAVRESQAAVRDRDFASAAECGVGGALGRDAALAAGTRGGGGGAAAREPWNWRPPLLLARVERRLGRPAAALREFRRARRLRPRAVIFEVLGRR